MSRIHHHTGGLENRRVLPLILMIIHHHTGGLEIAQIGS
ncbi:hypothetical protein [uncultured Gammaproteobacteria bacterium]|nr:hypothetical protein [uncultured Gammaproteobacteria bacterium]VVH55767.1 hypothetical protein BAZOLSSOX_546 [uncultured Gammaproteobacteria bacterium]